MARIKGVRVVSFARLKLDLKRGLGFSHDTEDGPDWEPVINLHDFAQSRGLARCPMRDDIEFKDSPKISWDDCDKRYRTARRNWEQGIAGDERYQKAALEIIAAQQTDAVRIRWFWLYGDRVHMLEGPASRSITDERAGLLVKHHVASEDAVYDRLQREIAAFDNLGRLKGVTREPISESVRLFVWQRDSKGGASTERNVQLLCGPCNKTKGSKI